MDAEARAQYPIRVVALALAVASIIVLLPFAVPLILAAWLAELLRGLVSWLERIVGGRRMAAAFVTALIVIAGAAPVALAVGVLVSGAGDLVEELRRVVAGGALDAGVAPSLPSLRDFPELVGKYGAGSAGALVGMLRSSARLVIDFVVLVATLYVLAVKGSAVRAWLKRIVPVSGESFERLASAFSETGRGLIVGIGGTALVQGVVATVAYSALGVPHPALFGFLTAVAAAMLPGVGTAIVWVPIVVALAVLGRPVRAVILAAIGAGVISTIDNVLRPVLARYGKLQLPVLVVFVSMLGGLFVMGGTGIVVGPLLVRMAIEAVALVQEQRPSHESGPRTGP